MQPPSVTIQKRYWFFIACLSLLLIMMGWIATSRYGAGVTSDSVKYMAVAQNLLDGNGLYDHRGLPLLSWPPLYSMSLAGLSWLTGLDVFVAGWYLNIILLGVDLILSGVILWRVFTDNPLYAYLASLFVFFSLSSLRNHAAIGSDAPYLTLTLAFLILLNVYVEKRSYTAFVGMVLLSALAPLLRYVGMALAVTAFLVIAIEQRKSIRALLRDGFVLGLFSILPIFWWLVIRNIMTFGTLFGTTSDQIVDVVQNIELALTKMLHWFVPYFSFLMPLLTRPFIILVVLALVLVLINIKNLQRFEDWGRTFVRPSTYPTMIYALVYFFAVAFTAVTIDHRSLQSDRYYFILLVPIMILVFVTFDVLVKPHLRFSPQQIKATVLAVFLLWSFYPLYSLREYLSEALERGEPSEYNLFNTRTYHEMNVVVEMQNLREAHPDEITYSNYLDAVWFYTRKPVRIPPFRDMPDPTVYTGWPNDKPGYFVWFKPNEYKHYLSPDELSEFATLQLIYSDDSGDIYYVTAR